jgi:peptide synthetase PhsA
MVDPLGAAPASGCPVVAAFEARADADPAAPAVVGDGDVVTFGQLEAAANGVAGELLARRGPALEPVALMVRDPARMLAAMLGVLKAGKFYTPVNPVHPRARQEAALAQVRAGVVLTDGTAAGAGRLPGPARYDVREWEPRPRSIRPDIRPTDPAYVLFTSGSTGVPKGIAHNRGDMWHNVGRHAALGVRPRERVSLISADGFVAAVSNVYIALLNGAALAPYSVHDRGVHELVPWLRGSAVSVCYSFPSFLRQAAAGGPGGGGGGGGGGGAAPGVRLVYLGGEPVHCSDVVAARTLAPDATVAVGLNSSETGLLRLKLIPPGDPVPDPVPVGGPVPDVEVVVRAGAAPAPPGVAGEIVVRSTRVAPSRVEQGTFVPLATAVGDPAAGLRELHTGDRGRMDGGELIHLGRSDGMVKIRGFRVEVGEVESALAGLPGVSEAAVVPYHEDSLTVELAAHLVPAGPDLTPGTVRQRLARLLPAPSIPTRVWVETALPRTANGKVDRQALSRLTPVRLAAGREHPAPVPAARERPAAGEHPAPARPGPGPDLDTVRTRLTGLWCETLDLPVTAPGDDFFHEGGTSITALRLVSKVRREFGVPLKLAVVFETPTLAALVTAVVELLPATEQVST